MAAIKSVTFDLWQTLLLDNRQLGRARMQLRLNGALEVLQDAGERFTEDRVRESYRQCYRTCHDIRAQELDVSFMEQVQIFISNIDQGLLQRLNEEVVRKIATLYADSFCHYPPTLHPSAVGVLHSVKEEGYSVGLISNTGMTPGATFRSYMKQLGILDYFDALIFSDEVRLAKPSREIFIRTAKELGAPPEQMVHVGDHLLNDVLGAKKAGMKTIWIETHEEGRQEVDVSPDITVPSLEQVNEAIETLATGPP